jgi:hypothetical protein
MGGEHERVSGVGFVDGEGVFLDFTAFDVV